MGGKPRRAAVHFAATDGWLLAAAALATKRGCARWRDIVGTADYLDHAIPTYDHLAGAAARLHAAGLAAMGPRGLAVSPPVLAAIDRSQTLVSARTAAVRQLAAPTPNHPATNRRLRLRREDYEMAVRIHLASG